MPRECYGRAPIAPGAAKATYIKAAGPGMRAELIGHVMHGQIAPIVALPLFSG